MNFKKRKAYPSLNVQARLSWKCTGDNCNRDVMVYVNDEDVDDKKKEIEECKLMQLCNLCERKHEFSQGIEIE